MYAAAADLDNGGVVTDVFAGVAAPPGSVPQLRLLAALHHLVLAGRAPDLAVASEPQLLAWCGDHGPPVVWVHVAGPPV